MKNYRTFAQAHRRLAILKLLRAAPGKRENGAVLKRLLFQRGHSASLDMVRTDLAWLDEQGHVVLEVLDEGLCVATLTDRGTDIADGQATAPGIAEPGAGI